MPGMDGFELLHSLRRLQQANPAMKTIILSAYDRTSMEESLKGLRFTRYIEKPLRLDELAREIREALRSRR